MRRKLRVRRLPILVLAVLMVVACGLPQGVAQTGREPVRIGTGPEREATLLANILAKLLEANDVPAEVVAFGHSRDARQALELRGVDVLPSYTGAVGIDEYGWSSAEGDVRNSFERVKRADEENGLVWLPPTQANATFAFVVAGPPARMARLQTLSQLASYANDDPDARLCVDPEFAERPDGLETLARIYSLRDDILVRQVLRVSPADTVGRVERGECSAGLVTATDGQAWVAGLQPVQDDLKAFPAFVVAPVVTVELRASRPEVLDALAPFGEAVTTTRLAQWNGRVILGEPVESVASSASARLRVTSTPKAA
ncbi:MAG: glycine betaine ABC transporter substrate-binding protein [Nitriliruptorales bacterium]